jgi:hypothetical protein
LHLFIKEVVGEEPFLDLECDLFIALAKEKALDLV